jgi:hypothetical protein
MAKLRWILLIFGLMFIAFGAYGLLSQSPLSNIISVSFLAFGAITNLLQFLFIFPLVNPSDRTKISSHQDKTKISSPPVYVSSVRPLHTYARPAWPERSSSKAKKQVSWRGLWKHTGAIVGMGFLAVLLIAFGIIVPNDRVDILLGGVVAIYPFVFLCLAILETIGNWFNRR